jgi:hypothetical protein
LPALRMARMTLGTVRSDLADPLTAPNQATQGPRTELPPLPSCKRRHEADTELRPQQQAGVGEESSMSGLTRAMMQGSVAIAVRS